MTSYHAEDTGQIREADRSDERTTLVIHESYLSMPLCGTPVRPWHGREMIYIDLGPGEVTCGRCCDGHAAMTSGDWRRGDSVEGQACPGCHKITVIYNGNYFCTACDWAMDEELSPIRIVRAYLAQRIERAKRAGDSREVTRLKHYLAEVMAGEEPR